MIDNSYLVPNRMMLKVPDDKGLICGFRLHAQELAQPLSWNTIAQTHGVSNDLMWLHFNLTDTRARNWIAACDRIPQAARDVILANDSQIRGGDALLSRLQATY